MARDKRTLLEISKLIVQDISYERSDDVFIEMPDSDGGTQQIRIAKILFEAPEKTRLQILNKRRCAASGWGSDSECNWRDCPQVRDGEPRKSGRHCPLDTFDEEDD